MTARTTSTLAAVVSRDRKVTPEPNEASHVPAASTDLPVEFSSNLIFAAAATRERRFTREIYDEAALFTDEIDTYTLPSFIKGTSALFVPERSVVKLVGDVEASTAKVITTDYR